MHLPCTDFSIGSGRLNAMCIDDWVYFLRSSRKLTRLFAAVFGVWGMLHAVVRGVMHG